MTTPQAPPRAVNVHVASVAEGLALGGPAAAAPPERIAGFLTIVFSSTDAVHRVLMADPNRIIAHVQAGGANVVLCKSKGDAQAAANTADPTLAAPLGTIIPYANTVPYPLDTTSEVWAAAASYPAQLSVSIITRRAG